MVIREGNSERNWYMVGLEEMRISDNMKPDIMVPRKWRHLPTQAHTIAMCNLMTVFGKPNY